MGTGTTKPNNLRMIDYKQSRGINSRQDDCIWNVASCDCCEFAAGVWEGIRGFLFNGFIPGDFDYEFEVGVGVWDLWLGTTFWEKIVSRVQCGCRLFSVSFGSLAND